MNPVLLLLERLTALTHRLDNYANILSGGYDYILSDVTDANVVDISDPISVKRYLTSNYYRTLNVYNDICRLLEYRGICYRDDNNQLRPSGDYSEASLSVLMDLTAQCELRMDSSHCVLDMIQEIELLE